MKSKIRFIFLPILFFLFSIGFFVLFFITDENVNIEDFKLPEINFDLQLPKDLGLQDDTIVISTTGRTPVSQEGEIVKEESWFIKLFKIIFKKSNFDFKIIENEKVIANEFLFFTFDNSTMLEKENEKIVVKKGEQLIEFDKLSISNLKGNFEIVFRVNETFKEVDNQYFPNKLFFNGKYYFTYMADFATILDFESNTIKLGDLSKIEFFYSKDREELFTKFYPQIYDVNFKYQNYIDKFFSDKYKVWEEQLTANFENLNELIESIFAYKYSHPVTEFPEVNMSNIVEKSDYLLDYRAAIWVGRFYEKEKIFYNRLSSDVYRYRDYIYLDNYRLLKESENAIKSISIFPNVILSKNLESYIEKIDISALDVISLKGYIDFSIYLNRMDNKLAKRLVNVYLASLKLNGGIFSFNQEKGFALLFSFLKLGEFLNDNKIIDIAKCLILNNLENDKDIKSYLIYEYFNSNGFPKVIVEKDWQVLSTLDEISIEDNSLEKSLDVTIRGKVDEIYNLVIYNIKNFADLEMFERRWQRDFQYQKYNSGAYFDFSNRKLFIKIKLRSEEEKLIIKYYNYMPVKQSVETKGDEDAQNN